eukprot:g11865.t1
MAAAPIYSPPSVPDGGSSHTEETRATSASPAEGTTGFFDRRGDDVGYYCHPQQRSQVGPPRARDPSFHGRHGQPSTPESQNGAAIDSRNSVSLGTTVNPPVGLMPAAAEQGQHNHFAQQHRLNHGGQSRLDLPPAGGTGGAGYSPEVGAHGRQRQNQRQQSAVGAVIAEVVAARQSRGPRSDPRSRSTDMDIGMDADIVRRGTPMSEGRQAMAQPRLLLSELEADDGPRSPGTASMLGRRKTREDDAVHEDSRKAPGMARVKGKDGGGAPLSTGDETDCRSEEDEEEGEPRDILAVCKHGNNLGIAAYREAMNAIDIQETHAFPSDIADTIESIKLIVRPRLILVDLTMATNQPLFQMVVAPLIDGGDPIDFRLVKRMSWDYQSAVRGICANLQVQSLKGKPSHAADFDEGARRFGVQGADGVGASGDPLRDAFNRLGSVRALGALLTHLQSTVFALEESGAVDVTSVRQLDVSGSMRIDGMTLRSLGIMAEEFHPNVISGKGRSKEGFSVFGLFDQTKSASGRRCLKEWMLKPLHDISAISARQVASSFADWCKLIQSIEAALEIREGLAILKTSADAAVAVEGSYGQQAFLGYLIESIDSVVLRRCLEGLCEVIDTVASVQDKEVVIRPGFDDELDRMRDLLGDLPEILRRVGKIVLNDNALLEELSVEYVPQIGFLTALHERFSDLKPDDFTFAFTQGDTVYYKSPTMHDVDDGIGDIQGKITDKQAKIMRELEEALLEEEGSFHTAAAALAELDAALALAAVAGDFGFVRPEVVEDNVIMIKNGRHPLQEHTVDHFIPNDTYIADGSRVALITGANCSGKSVYLKQVGVAVYLAHVGSFVPAEKAIIGLTDRIFTRIATVETSALPQSSFTIDVNQIAHMVRSSSPRSLLLIDEFGKGTSPSDGIGLVAALLRHLSRGRRKCLFTLHFHEIFSLGLVKVHGPDDMRTELQDVSVFRMDVHVPSAPTPAAEHRLDGLGQDDPGDGWGDDGGGWATTPPTPLFKLVPGVTANSHGIACAQLAGIPESVLSRAREVAGSEDSGKPIQPMEDARQGAGLLTLASSEVQQALRLFINPPDDARWKDAPDELLSALLNKVDTLEKEATVHPSTDIEGLVSVTLEEAFRGKDVFVTVPRRGSGFTTLNFPTVTTAHPAAPVGRTVTARALRPRETQLSSTNLMKSFQPKAANEQASTDNETDAPVRDATDPAPTPSPAPPPPPDTTSPTSTKAFFAPPRPKVKTGSFRLTVDVLEHPVFWRGDDGPDLFTSVAISLDEALTGFTREITALDGSVVSLRRTDRTLPGMVLRFPGLGMPIAVPQDRNGPTTSYADNSKPMSPLPGHITKVAGNNVIEVVSGAPAGAAAEEGRTEEDSASASAGRNVGFGDLFVEASVTLPSGIRDDRSKFIGEFLKPGSDEAREEEGKEGIEQEGRERWETRRGWSRRERRRRAEAEAGAEAEAEAGAEAAVDDVPEA